jgi:replicative superfamily II helicase
VLVQKRADIIHSAAALLEKCNLMKYERATGRFQSTELGRIASHYYVTYNSMSVYNQHLRSTMSQLELFRVFALSNEFKLIPVRQEVRDRVFGACEILIPDDVGLTGEARAWQTARTRAYPD